MTTLILTDQVAATLEGLLTLEGTLGPTQRLAELEARHQTIDEIIGAIEDTADRLRRRASRFSRLPDREAIQWARTVLRLPNLAFPEVDTDGLSEDADLLRVVLLKQEGEPLSKQTVKPRRPLSDNIRHLRAMEPGEVADAPTLTQVWDELTRALCGRSLLSFNLPLATGKLAENAARSHLSPVTIIGACLMKRAGRSFKQSTYPNLSALCARTGHPFPDHPTQTAWGQIALVKALSEGMTDAPAPDPAPQDDPDDPDPCDDLDTHPCSGRHSLLGSGATPCPHIARKRTRHMLQFSPFAIPSAGRLCAIVASRITLGALALVLLAVAALVAVVSVLTLALATISEPSHTIAALYAHSDRFTHLLMLCIVGFVLFTCGRFFLQAVRA
jgi:hypothetical protein